MNILHTEASPGWGGQEIRILREAEGMRARGHTVILAVQKGGGLVKPAREAGFEVIELPFTKARLFSTFWKLLRLVRRRKIHIINTHSSLDAWIGGIVGKLLRCRVIRTRHLSTPIRKGLNSRLLYNTFADQIVTTCAAVVPTICQQANLPEERCCSIPTGVNPKLIQYTADEVASFRKEIGVAPDECLVGTLCVLRGWKGVSDLLHAAKQLQHLPKLKWVVIGSGVSEAHFRQEWQALGLEERVIFAGYRSPPYAPLAALDIFALLSWANEGVSQASLQAAWLEKPLVTTAIGGLPEVCLDGKTGIQVPSQNPQAIAAAVEKLYNNPDLREVYGKCAKALVHDRFTLDHTLDQMEALYK